MFQYHRENKVWEGLTKQLGYVRRVLPKSVLGFLEAESRIITTLVDCTWTALIVGGCVYDCRKPDVADFKEEGEVLAS